MLEKLNDMIQDRYGKGFSVRKLTAVENGRDFETHFNNQDLYVPILVKDVFLGYGLVHQATDLSLEQQQQISKLIRMVLEPELYSEHLERTLHNLQIEKEGTVQENTVSNGKLIFVYGHSPTRVQKIALEIHEISQNMSYLPLHDILPSLQTTEDLSSMDGSTLVVDLEKPLSLAAQDILVHFMATKKSGPLLIFTSSKPTYLLQEAQQLSSALLDVIKNHEFSVDRLPVDKVMLRDVLEMMYFETQG